MLFLSRLQLLMNLSPLSIVSLLTRLLDVPPSILERSTAKYKFQEVRELEKMCNFVRIPLYQGADFQKGKKS